MAEDVKPMANEEAKATVDVLSSPKTPSDVKTPVQPTAVTTPQPAKEVKRVAKNGFDYTNCKTYTVKEGQTLLDVANEVLVAYRQLRYFNGLPKNNPTVKAGQVIYIPDHAVDVPLEG